MALQVSDELREALRRLRDDKCPDDFVLAAFEDDSKLTVAGAGEGGIEALKGHLMDNDICYGIVRHEFTWEKVGQVQADTTKFVFIVWRPESIPLKRKMKIGSLDGQIKKLFSNFHTSMDVNSKDELSEEIIANLIKEITMTADKRTDRKSQSMFMNGLRLSWKRGKEEADAAKMKPDSRADFSRVARGANVSFEDEDAIKDAIKDVRSDASATRWCLAGYTGKDVVGLLAKGDGDVSELLTHCKDTQVAYGLFRITEQYDKTASVKFCFVVWTPDNVPPMTKARIATHKGTVTPMFRPFHQDFHISDKEDLSEEIALEKIASLTGTKSHVTQKRAVRKEEHYERKFLGGVKGETQNLVFTDKEALLVAIADVRNDASPTNWVLAAYEGDKKDVRLAMRGSGAGGINELTDHLEEGRIMFALLRTTEKIDRTTAVKFYFVKWEGAGVPLTTKGAMGIYTGAVTAFFSPFHDDVFGASVDDLLSNAKKRIKQLEM